MIFLKKDFMLVLIVILFFLFNIFGNGKNEENFCRLGKKRICRLFNLKKLMGFEDLKIK